MRKPGPGHSATPRIGGNQTKGDVPLRGLLEKRSPVRRKPPFDATSRDIPALPASAAHLHGFARLLRNLGFRIAPEQAMGFLRAVGLLGPRSMEDIRQAALATLAPQPDRRAEFDALFLSYFHGAANISIEADSEDDVFVKDHEDARYDELPSVRRQEGGTVAAAREQLSGRQFERSERLAAFSRALPAALPVRRSFRTISVRSRGALDLRRSLRTIVSADGDMPRPFLKRRRTLYRKLLILVDISGSMKLHTADYLRVAHATVQAVDRVEIFTIGTRLTRITAALHVRDRDQALARASAHVDDWDGGTRIGATLLAFLAVPRFAAFARGAAVIVLSDGLERGDPIEMERAIRRLSARAFRLSLCTPLAGDARFRPETKALKAILPVIDDLADASSITALTDFILSLARPAKAAAEIWRSTP